MRFPVCADSKKLKPVVVVPDRLGLSSPGLLSLATGIPDDRYTCGKYTCQEICWVLGQLDQSDAVPIFVVAAARLPLSVGLLGLR